MKKNSTCSQSWKGRGSWRQGSVTIGMDLGDKNSRYCVLNEKGEIVKEGRLATSKKGLAQEFGALRRCRIALEVGTHSPWVSRYLSQLGHEAIVANARQVQRISQSSRKDDRLDAEMLARLARVDAQLLRPIRHRSESAQMHLMRIRVRAAMVETRTSLINTARGLSKSAGERLPQCDAAHMGVERIALLPAELQRVLGPLLEEVEALSQRISACEAELKQIAQTEYPETRLLEQVSGVGTLIALTFVLTLEDPARFAKSRDVGCYVGLRPKRSESGESQRQLRITKEGDVYLRKLLVQGAHYILSERGPDTNLKRWGQKLASSGGKTGKKRAVVAVARKLAILLHRLWVSGEVYEPLHKAPDRRPWRAAG